MWSRGPSAIVSWLAWGRLRLRCGFTGLNRFAVGVLDRTDLLEDLLNLGGGDDGFVRAQKVCTLVADGLFQVGNHLAPVGVVSELFLGAANVFAQRVVTVFVDLIGVAVQIDGNYFIHTQRPS